MNLVDWILVLLKFSKNKNKNFFDIIKKIYLQLILVLFLVIKYYRGVFIFKLQWDKEVCYYYNYVILFWKFKLIYYYIKREKEV